MKSMVIKGNHKLQKKHKILSLNIMLILGNPNLFF